MKRLMGWMIEAAVISLCIVAILWAAEESRYFILDSIEFCDQLMTALGGK